MSVNNLLSDSVARIRNGYTSKLKKVYLLRSKFIIKVLDLLLKEGFIFSYSILNDKNLVVYLKYFSNGSSIINDIKLISKPSIKHYVTVKDLWVLNRNYSRVFVISTTKGLLTSKEALNNNVGGKLLFYIS